jgi:hypothetical protein
MKMYSVRHEAECLKKEKGKEYAEKTAMGQIRTFEMRIYAERGRVYEGARNGKMENEQKCRRKQWQKRKQAIGVNLRNAECDGKRQCILDGTGKKIAE